MARKRSTPKPPAASPPAIPFPDDAPDQPAEALFDLLATVASASGAVRLRRLVLIRSAVDIHPDGPVEGLNTLGMGPPEVRFQHDDEDGILQVVCTCRLDA